MIYAFSTEYQRKPNAQDFSTLAAENNKSGFQGMLTSLDCMHWQWKNCPKDWHGAYIGKEGSPSQVLEAVASKILWIWHLFFGFPGSLNNISILDWSHLLINCLKV